jgi:aminoglycoside phosphotransferase (APT) family kinase protein
VHRHLQEWLKVWSGRRIDGWCHGDLHPANALSRLPCPGGPAVLIDFAEVHAGHWVEDATYFEHLFWARRQRLGGRNLCRQIAQERKKRGLPVDPDWPILASIRRVLLAMSTPALLAYDGDRVHVRAALEVLEQETGSP